MPSKAKLDDAQIQRRDALLDCVVNHALKNSAISATQRVRKAPSAFSRDIRPERGTCDDSGLLEPPHSTGRQRQAQAVATIEHFYSAFSRATPDQLYLDLEKTKRAEWGVMVVQPTHISHTPPIIAKYLRVGTSTPPSRVARLLAKYWKLPRPSVVLSVTGGAVKFRLSPGVEEALSRALVCVSMTTSALVVTGGTDTGVMQLVGRLMGAAEGAKNRTLVGVAPYQMLTKKESLADNHGEEEPREYGPVPEGKDERGKVRIGLEPHHTHFVLVDAGQGSSWGAEIDMRSEIEQMYMCACPPLFSSQSTDARLARRRLYSVPCVQLVVQGGPGTLKTVESSLALGTRVVVLEESGGAASIICDYVKGWNSQTGGSSFDLATVDNGKWLKHAATLAEVGRLHEQHGLLVIFSTVSSDQELENVLLQAVLTQYEMDTSRTARGEPPSPRRGAHHTGPPVSRSLQVAVQWARVDVMIFVVEQLLSHPNRDNAHKQLQWALQVSLEAKRESVVALLLQEASSVVSLSEVDVTMLFKNCGSGAHSGGLSENLGAFQAMPHDLRKLSAAQRAALFRQYVLPLLPDAAYRKAFKKRSKSGLGFRGSDVFVWAVAVGEQSLARVLWKRVKNPIRMALLAARMCLKMGQKFELQRELMATHAEEYEMWASGVLDHMPHDQAGAFLTYDDPQWGTSVLQDGFEYQHKQFMSHHHCRLLVQQYSESTHRLRLPPRSSNAAIVLQIIGIKSIRSCTDLVEQDWEIKKRRLSFSDQRSQAPKLLSLWAIRREFYCIPRVKSLLRGVCHGIYLMLYIATIFYAADRRRIERANLCLDQEAAAPPAPPDSLALFESLLIGEELAAENPPWALWPWVLPSGVRFVRLVLLALWTLSLAVDELYQWVNEGGNYFKSVWNVLDAIANATTMLALWLSVLPNPCDASSPPPPPPSRFTYYDEHQMRALRGVSGGVAYDADPHENFIDTLTPSDLSLLLLGFNAVFLSLAFAKMAFVRDRTYGPLLVIVMAMIQDVKQFFLLFSCIISGFALAFISVFATQANLWRATPILWGLLEFDGEVDTSGLMRDGAWPADDDQSERWTVWSAMFVPLWAAVGGDVYEQVVQDAPTVGMGLLWMYVLLAQVLLVNLLIAMMNATYTKYSDTAEREFMYNRCFDLMESQALCPVPPPLSLPFLFWRLLMKLPPGQKSRNGLFPPAGTWVLRTSNDELAFKHRSAYKDARVAAAVALERYEEASHDSGDHNSAIAAVQASVPRRPSAQPFDELSFDVPLPSAAAVDVRASTTFGEAPPQSFENNRRVRSAVRSPRHSVESSDRPLQYTSRVERAQAANRAARGY